MRDPDQRDLADRRRAVVVDHMESEITHDFDAVIATFDHPRYELIGTGQVFDGEDEVRGYFATSRAAFPDQRSEVHSLRAADDAVIVEFDLLGTHLGEFLGVEPTGQMFRVRMCAVFEFDDGDRITCERIYFDPSAILRQLGLASPGEP